MVIVLQLVHEVPKPPARGAAPPPQLHHEENMSVVVPELRAASDILSSEMVFEVRLIACKWKG